jgi:hypothetical protein
MAQRRQTPQEKFAQIKAAHLQKMGGESSLFPSTPVPEKATKKALLALQSELRRLERALQEKEERLEHWEADLQEREADWQEAMCGVGDDDYEECEAESAEECDCGPQDALDGCECFTCESWREYNPAAMRAAGSRYMVTERRPMPESLKQGDEVDWLNKLFLLKDKRRKK